MVRGSCCPPGTGAHSWHLPGPSCGRLSWRDPAFDLAAVHKTPQKARETPGPAPPLAPSWAPCCLSGTDMLEGTGCFKGILGTCPQAGGESRGSVHREPSEVGMENSHLAENLDNPFPVPVSPSASWEGRAHGLCGTNQGMGRGSSRRRMTIAQSLEHPWIKVRWLEQPPLRDSVCDKVSVPGRPPGCEAWVVAGVHCVPGWYWSPPL